MKPHIGAWVRRESGTGSPITKGHLVESIVADDAIVKCGKRLRDEKRPPLTVHTGMVSRANKPLDWELCWFCDGRPHA